jgi:hypothetical protein
MEVVVVLDWGITVVVSMAVVEVTTGTDFNEKTFFMCNVVRTRYFFLITA